MTVLHSYVGGEWTAPADEGRPVLDAVTGEEVARVSAAADSARRFTFPFGRRGRAEPNLNTAGTIYCGNRVLRNAPSSAPEVASCSPLTT